MESFELLMHGFSVALTPTNLLAVFIGVFLGQVIGALPGIGPSLGMALLLPISFGLPSVTAIVLLCGIMYGAMYGGTLTSVLINVPGESSGIMTTLEGYKLARKGRGGAALCMAAIGSFIGGTGTIFFLMFATVWISEFALHFGPPEYFLLAALGITATASMGEGSTTKALFVAVIGLMIALVGTDPILGTERLTFGNEDLIDGIDFLPIAIGVFGIAEVLVSIESLVDLEPMKTKLRDMWPRWKDWVQCRMAILRGTGIGFGLGLLPGVGPTASTFIAYAVERRFSKKPEDFGHGSLDAVASVETANNSAVVGSLVPMLTLGIPGSGLTAVLLAAFTLQGIRPGPLLMTSQPDLVWGLIASMFIGNLMLLVLNLPLAPFFASLLRVPYAYLAPGILMLSLVGAYATDLRLFTVGMSVLFGVIGYFMIKARLPRAPLILGIVLAPILESSLRQTMILSHGSLNIFVERPLALVLVVVVLLSLVLPSAGRIWRFVRGGRAGDEGKVNMPAQ
ncbi:tripartite tricarboxylate transporter permease [Ancylobacter terrae]|uniref:tripartite tricarboxylate transporter permease n=1 Tax=Ancylobacter sp. sgz301288 TaxID=3342077 RepID=UPI00385A1FA7